jgi:hypothetical protein
MGLSTFLNGRAPTTLRGVMMLALSESGQRGTAAWTSDTGGGASSTWAFGGTVPCRIDPLGAGSGVSLAGRIDERSTHLVTAAPGGTVLASDRFLIAGRGTFEVTATREQTSRLSVEFEVIQVA